MATISDLTRQHTRLDRADVAHLQRLVGEWGMLADLSFADQLLYVPAGEGRWLVVAQVRPVTSQTIYDNDWIGTWANESERPLLAAAYDAGAILEGEVTVEGMAEPTRLEAVPVRREGRVIAVLTREWSPLVGRSPGQLERTYLSIYERLAAMIASGQFPFDAERATTGILPRVGDGVMLLDADARLEYASPNAVSALHKVGITANAVGHRLAELGFDDSAVVQAFEQRRPDTAEVEADTEADVVLVTRCTPLLEGDELTGGVMLVRDVTEVRRRDRMILSRDATIREIHHRVKNNLQTISSLLRLQGRRTRSAEAKQAISESVRRIRTIALVHETLSREASDDVAFVEIVRPLARLAEEGLQSPDRPLRFRVVGDGGKLPAPIATPLAVVLTELLQNAVDHGFGDTAGNVVVLLRNDGHELVVKVVDDGGGLPEGFSLDEATGLGLSIVRTLVTTELNGHIEMRSPRRDDCDEAGLSLPAGGSGTAVVVRVPVHSDSR